MAQTNEFKPQRNEQSQLARTTGPEFVWQREDVLAVYRRPLDPSRPVVCLDETSRRMLGEVHPPPPGPGRPARSDPQQVRGGIANGFP